VEKSQREIEREWKRERVRKGEKVRKQERAKERGKKRGRERASARVQGRELSQIARAILRGKHKRRGNRMHLLQGDEELSHIMAHVIWREGFELMKILKSQLCTVSSIVTIAAS